MAKIVIKSEKFTLFGGFFPIMTQLFQEMSTLNVDF